MSERAIEQVLLVGLDGLEPALLNPLLEAGLLSNLQALTQRHSPQGLISTLASCRPALWTSILTGQRSDRHGILSYQTLNPETDTLQPVPSSDRLVPFLGEMLTHAGLRSHFVGFPATYPAENLDGVCISDAYPGEFKLGNWADLKPGTISAPDPAVIEHLKTLRMHPQQVTGEMIAPLLPCLPEIDQDGDRRPAAIAVAFARTLSYHNAVTWLLQRHPAEVTAVYYPLLDELSRTFLPYVAPKPETVSEQDFRLYQAVLPGAYAFMDMLLGRLRKLAGPDALIVLVSGHGFFIDSDRRSRGLADQNRANPDIRSAGWLALAGSKLQVNEPIYAPSVLDIVPTLLTALGLPVGQDMEGRPWVEAFDFPLSINRCPSWQEKIDQATDPSADPAIDPAQMPELQPEDTDLDMDALMAQLTATGLVDPLENRIKTLQQRLTTEQQINRYRCHSERSDLSAALRVLVELVQEQPENLGLRLELIQLLAILGQFTAARQLAVEIIPILENLPTNSPLQGDNLPRLALLRGLIAYADNKLKDAQRYFDEAGQQNSRSELIQVIRGRAYFKLENYETAAQAFQLAIDLNPQSGQGYAGLLHSLIKQKRYEEAIEPGLRAVELQSSNAQAHYQLGTALYEVGAVARAIVAFKSAQQLAPHWSEPQQWLRKLEAFAAAKKVFFDAP